jgi:hypothetical protein
MKPDAVTDCSKTDAHFALARSTLSVGNRPALRSISRST